MKVKITKKGSIYGADGKDAFGTVIEIKKVPAGWAGKYEVVTGDPKPDAEPVTNDDDKPKRRGRPAKD